MTEAQQPKRLRFGLTVALTAALALLCCGGGTGAFFLGGLGGSNDVDPFGTRCGRQGLNVDPNGELPRIGTLSEDQMHNAAVIISVGQQMGVPPRGWVIAIGTALQESALKNLGHLGSRNDHDSLGLFQQRPSQGWGSREQIMDPAYAARKFYEKLLGIAGWERMALTDAAQTVQRSAYPDAYANDEFLASAVVNQLADGAARAVGELSDLRCVDPGEISAAGWTSPLLGAIVSGFRTTERPNHHGVDIAAPKGTVIRAASGGVVVTSKCNVSEGWSCDTDGSSSIRGCGWYVDILHAVGVITRYCHMVSQPHVSVGEEVVPGQQIGLSGSSGNSSGPHLHFEVHTDGEQGSAGAINPVRFMHDNGAPLGEKQP